jgi:hypothetical protein
MAYSQHKMHPTRASTRWQKATPTERKKTMPIFLDESYGIYDWDELPNRVKNAIENR